MSNETPKKRENVFFNLVFNVVIPTVILMKFSNEEYLGNQLGLVVALSFPLTYGIVDFFRSGKINFFSALGFFGTLLTGGIGLLQLDPKYIAIKEAAIPGLIALAILGSLKTRFPLVKTIMFNENIMQVDKIHEALEKHGNENAFERVLVRASYILSGSFVLSSVLNYVLAKIIVVSPPGTDAFNEELGKMMAWSFPVISVPAMIVMMVAMFYLISQLQKLTHMALDDLVANAS
ncbi:VC0807 family protein [Marinibactrum halimedae]|uniref:MFS transporter n=1 Tax=Marinibactrum halimedae TaxID=1444977 RepID=A0AA37T390_9GAMM|nr:VC0807 family protein [Marinibactrum halimedae]MCD9458417.1 MFS transporter [Marinibactrum halimedae]GLS26114.1 hypothetical protein GCM10007877_18290 [Marinibactrum halimedae]